MEFNLKILEKLVLIIYSFLILIISVITCLLIFRVINIDNIAKWIEFLLEDFSLSIIVLAVSIICVLLSIKCLFFRNRKQIKKSNTTDILLENDSGRLLISKRAIENAVKNVINNAPTIGNPEIKVIVDIDPANNLSIYISILLNKNIKVKDFTLGLQSKIKDKIKEDFDLDVKQVNIKIDSIEKQNDKRNEKQVEKKEIISEQNKKQIIINKTTNEEISNAIKDNIIKKDITEQNIDIKNNKYNIEKNNEVEQNNKMEENNKIENNNIVENDKKTI